MALIELVTGDGERAGLTIESDFRYNPKKIKDALTLADIGLVTGLMALTETTNINDLTSRLYVPHSHFSLWKESLGTIRIGCQVRSESKQAFRGMTLPLTAGGHMIKDDFDEGGKDAYEKGSVREGKEELRNEQIRKSREAELGEKFTPFSLGMSDLIEIPNLAGVYDFSEQGLPNPVYLKCFAHMYDESKNGTIFTANGTDDITWLPLSEIERRSLHKPLGLAGEIIIEYFKGLRNEVRTGGK